MDDIENMAMAEEHNLSSLSEGNSFSEQNLSQPENPAEEGNAAAEILQEAQIPLEEEKLLEDFQQQVSAFSQENPDFLEALNFLNKKRDQQLQAYGVVDARFYETNIRAQQIEKEALEIIKLAHHTGRNPAQLIYEIARSYGYSHEQYYQKMAKAQEASRSLTATPGYRAGQPMNIDTLAEMSQKDFDQWYWQHKEEFRRIMGG